MSGIWGHVFCYCSRNCLSVRQCLAIANITFPSIRPQLGTSSGKHRGCSDDVTITKPLPVEGTAYACKHSLVEKTVGFQSQTAVQTLLSMSTTNRGPWLRVTDCSCKVFLNSWQDDKPWVADGGYLKQTVVWSWCRLWSTLLFPWVIAFWLRWLLTTNSSSYSDSSSTLAQAGLIKIVRYSLTPRTQGIAITNLSKLDLLAAWTLTRRRTQIGSDIIVDVDRRNL